MQHIRYLRRPELLRKLGVSNSTLCNRINDRIFVPPISLGGRAVGWIDYEVEAVLAAMASGYSRGELTLLVTELLSAR